MSDTNTNNLLMITRTLDDINGEVVGTNASYGMHYNLLEIGMSGMEMVDKMNSNWSATDAQLAYHNEEISLRIISNSVKDIEISDSGVVSYSLNGTDYETLNYTWGTISGNIQNQTDLYQILVNKANQTDLDSLTTIVNNNTSQLLNLVTQMTALSNTVSSLDNTVNNATTGLVVRMSAAETSLSHKISSSTILSIRESGSSFLEYTTDGTNWIPLSTVGTVEWGDVTGDIANQADLQNVFNAINSRIDALDNIIANGGFLSGTSVADTYDSSLTYSVGDYVVKEGVLYRCTVAIPTPEVWDSTHWSSIVISRIIDTFNDNFAPEYDSTETYNIGDTVTYYYKLYKCNTNNTTGVWDITYWDLISVSEAGITNSSLAVTTTATTAALTLTDSAGNDVSVTLPVATTAKGGLMSASDKVTLGNSESTSNKVTTISSSSSDTEYPSAKAVFTAIGGSSGMPIGAGCDFFGTTLPDGFMWADGSEISRTTYAALFAVIGTNYGAGNGQTTFNLPDKRERVTVGYKAGSTAGTPNATLGTLGAAGGENKHTLTKAEIPNYNLTVTDPGHTHSYSYDKNTYASDFDRSLNSPAVDSHSVTGSTTGSATTGITVSSGGSGTAMNNMQSYLVCNYIIRYN